MNENNDTTEDETIILGVIYSLEIRKKNPETGEITITDQLKIKPNLEGIIAFGNLRFKDKTANWSSLVKSLKQRKFLYCTEEIYFLTEKGRKIGKKIRTQWMSEGYDNLLLRCAKSKAYSLFCKKVFDKNLLQFNAMDMVQLNTMLDYLNMNNDDLVLDLGCGLGKVSEYISKKTGARIVGIDFSKKSIEWAKSQIQSKNKKLDFQVGNINDLKFSPSTFDAIISIDTLYFVEDMDFTISELKNILKPQGQMGIFYAQYRELDESIELLKPENTKVGKALLKNELSFQAVDFTDNAKELWLKEVSFAEELKDMFEKEGNLVLYNDRMEDAKRVLEWIKNEQEKRYFYYAKKNLLE
jgi:ubiquinone/menaquinone biosynthesis C-methylase UbiE